MDKEMISTSGEIPEKFIRELCGLANYTKDRDSKQP